MGFFKAGGKLAARMVSNGMYHSAEKKAQKQAYQQTGIQIKNAQKQGSYIDGSQAYQKNYAKAMSKPNENKALRDKFIDEI